MADKREDKGTDEGQEKQKPFIREKIVRQPPSGRQIMRKIGGKKYEKYDEKSSTECKGSCRKSRDVNEGYQG